MRKQHHSCLRELPKCSTVLLGIVLLCAAVVAAQEAPRPSQESINKRITEIIDHALQSGIVTTPDGVRATLMKADISLEELKEIKSYGQRAIMPLSKYFDSSDRRAQTLAVNLVGSIGGTAATTALSYAAEKCESPVARLVAVINLRQQPWQDVSEVIRRVSVNDTDSLVKKEARKMLAEHQETGKKERNTSWRSYASTAPMKMCWPSP